MVMGRRPKAERLKLSERVPILMTPEMKEALAARAKERGIDTSELVRGLIERELAGDRNTIEAIAGEGARLALEAAGYRVVKDAEE